MKIKIFNNIKDSRLKESWIRLQHDADVFPQMYFEWIEPWCRLRAENKDLHIITVLNDKKEIIAIAPFCEEKKFGYNVLNSIPIHYGDKYDFIICTSSERSLITKAIFSYLEKRSHHGLIKITQVNNSSALYKDLLRTGFTRKKLVDCPVSDFSNQDFDTFLMSLNRKVRSDYRRRQKRLKELGKVNFEVHNSSKFYAENEDKFRQLYERRWEDIDSNMPDDNYYRCRRQSFSSCLEKGKALIVVLKLDEVIIGYRLGFINKNYYHDWKICFDTEFSKMGIGSIMTGLLIQYLKTKDIDFLNHGAGNYSYKNDWTPKHQKETIFAFFKKKQNIFASFHFLFETKYKNKIKEKLVKYRLVNLIR